MSAEGVLQKLSTVSGARTHQQHNFLYFLYILKKKSIGGDGFDQVFFALQSFWYVNWLYVLTTNFYLVAVHIETAATHSLPLLFLCITLVCFRIQFPPHLFPKPVTWSRTIFCHFIQHNFFYFLYTLKSIGGDGFDQVFVALQSFWYINCL